MRNTRNLGKNMNLINLLRNRLFAIVLISFLVLFSFIIIIISSFNRGSAIKIFQSYIILGFAGIFLISLLFCSVYRLNSSRVDLPGIGSVLFHFSMAFIVLSAVYNHLFRVSASLIITEGQTVSCTDKNLKAMKFGRFAFKNFENFVLKLNQICLKYSSKTLERLSANITLQDIEKKIRKNENISVNYPMFYRGKKFLMNGYGFSPKFVLKKNGRNIKHAYVNLDLIVKKSMKSDKFYFNNWLIDVLFYPDFHSDGRNDTTLSMELKNPLFFLKITERDSEKRLFTGKLKMNEPIEIGGHTISIEDMRYWIQLYISSEDGIKFIYLGFWLGIIGLILRFIKLRRIKL